MTTIETRRLRLWTGGLFTAALALCRVRWALAAPARRVAGREGGAPAGGPARPAVLVELALALRVEDAERPRADAGSSRAAHARG